MGLFYLTSHSATFLAHCSVSGESLAAGGGSMSDVAVPASTNESSAMGLMTVKDIGTEPAASEGAKSNLWLHEDPY